MRHRVTTAAELLGATSVALGAGLLALPAGLIVGGVMLIVFAWRAAE